MSKPLQIRIGILTFAILIIAFGFAWSAHTHHDGRMNDGEGVFPVLHINTRGLDFYQLTREDWERVALSLYDASGNEMFTNVSARIRGRGNSTWHLAPADPLNRTFRIRFNEPQEMMERGYFATDWTMIANHFDFTMLRQYSAYYLGNLFAQTREDNLYFSPSHQFIDVYINGVYWGVYMLSAQVNDGAGDRANLRFHADPTLSEFMIEQDHPDHRGREHQMTIVEGELYYAIRFPRSGDVTDAHINYVHATLLHINDVIRSLDFNEIIKYIDVSSFVDFYIISEWYQNHDITHSIFLQIRGVGEGRRLYKGPIWDFDLAAGGGGIRSRQQIITRNNIWFSYLMQVPEFVDAVALRWHEVNDELLAQTIARIYYVASYYRTGFERNFERWPILGTRVAGALTPEYLAELVTFMEHVAFLIDFLEDRRDFITFNLSRGHRVWSVPLRDFYSSNGTLQEAGWVSGREGGALIFGPYLSLGPGQYEVVLTATLESYEHYQVAVFDVGIHVGDARHHFRSYASMYASCFARASTQRFSIPFMLETNACNIEFRVFTTRGAVVTVESVVITGM